MAIDITDNGATLKYSDGYQTRNIVKAHILEIAIVKTNLIKIDIGKELKNIFFPFGDVTTPVTANIDALRDALNAMLLSGSGGQGTATEVKQIEEITKLNDISTSITTLQNSVNTIDSKIFFDPIIIDDTNPNVEYRGFAMPGTGVEAQTWAILKVTYDKEVTTYKWASGTKGFDKTWTLRMEYQYS